MSAACENYKADNGIYPRSHATTPDRHDRRLDRASRTAIRPAKLSYDNASLYLYTQIQWSNLNRTADNRREKVYFCVQAATCSRPDANGNVTAIQGSLWKLATAIRLRTRLTPTKGYNPNIRSLDHGWPASQQPRRAAGRPQRSGSKTGKARPLARESRSGGLQSAVNVDDLRRRPSLLAFGRAHHDFDAAIGTLFFD